MPSPSHKINRGAGRWYARRANVEALALLALLALAVWAATMASAVPGPSQEASPETTRLVYAPGKIVPLPASIPHEPGDMVDRRIVPNLRWIAERYPIFVTDGYSGSLPSGRHVGCDECHVRNSDHYNGLAVDIVPVGGGTRCDRSWQPLTRLALWAEPTPGQPRPPFRWVGYDGDSGHGCGHHLHLSWNHAVAPMFKLAEWVETFPSVPGEAVGKPKPPVKPPAPPGPPGGIAQASTGGISPRGD